MVETHQYPEGAKRLAIIAVVMAASIMQILDSTIANVALPHMRATLGATQEQISWVLTSYILATAITIPATGFLEGLVSRRTLFLTSLIGFTLSSAFCGVAWSLPAMIFARILQGAFGAFISPLAQAIMIDSSPPEKRAQTMMIWGMGVMVAPLLGPVLGGWLTDQASWRWVFFVNIPIGALTIIFAATLIDKTQRIARSFDWRGYLMIALGLASLQLALDRGTSQDWFSSIEIIFELGLAVSLLWMFIIHTRSASSPIIAREVFADRNMMVACMVMLIASGSLIVGATFITLMLQGVMGYGTTDAGLMSVPRGIAMIIAMLFAGRLNGKIDNRLMLGFGLICVGAGYVIMTGSALGMDGRLIITSGLLQGLGFGFIMLPTNMLGFSTLAARFRTEGASIYALARNIGSSILIALGTASIARDVQISHSDLSSNVTNQTIPFMNAGLLEQLGFRGDAVMSALDLELGRQALMIAYDNVFFLSALLCFAILPLILFVREGKAGATGDAPQIEAH